MKKCISLFLTVFIFLSGTIIGIPFTQTANAVASLQFADFESLGRGFNLLDDKPLENSSLLGGLMHDSEGIAAELTYVGKTYASVSSITDMGSYFESEVDKWNASLDMNVRTMFVAIDLKTKFDYSNSSEHRNATSTYYSSVDVRAMAYLYDMNLKNDVGLIWSNLTPHFKEALLNPAISPAELFELYGTHMVTRYHAGGIASAYTSGISTASEFKTETDWGINGSVQVSTNVVFDATAKLGYENQKVLNQESSNTKTVSSSFVRGGNNFFATNATGDAVVDANSYNEWLESLTAEDVITKGTKTQILTDDMLQMVAVWDLLPIGNEQRKAELKNYFDTNISADIADFYNTFIYKDKLPQADNFDAYADYICITNAEEFNAIRNDLNGKYFILNDIDMSSIPNFKPIGTESNPFTGELIGKNVTISGLQSFLSTDDEYYAYGIVGCNKGIIDGISAEGILYNKAGQAIANFTTVSIPKKSLTELSSVQGTAVETIYNSVANTPETIACTTDGSAIIIDWRNESSAAIDKEYTIASNVDTICFVGNGENSFSDMSIYANKRTTPLNIYFENFSFSAQKDIIALDASKTSVVNVYSHGTKNTIIGGNGSNATNDSTATGYNGYNGQYAIYAKNICLGGVGEFYVYGGTGGTAGKGSNAAAVTERGSTGNTGFPGGKGGDGAPAVCATNINIIQTVQLYLTGGTGGTGGVGGRGGDGAVGTAGWIEFGWRGEDGGTGGTGGTGGIGGTGGNGANAVSFLELTSYNNHYTTLIGGNGGKGGNGGTGGDGGKGGSSSNIEVSDVIIDDQFDGHNGGRGGTNGMGGKGGNGGNYAPATEDDLNPTNVNGLFLYQCGTVCKELSVGGKAGNPGQGGTKGSVRYHKLFGSYKTYYGVDGATGNTTGTKGANGINPNEALLQRILVDNTNIYALLVENTTWTAAQDVGTQNNAKLMSVYSEERQQKLEKLTADFDVTNCWIGANDSAKEGFWYWENGLEIDYDNWTKGEPANKTGNDDYAYYSNENAGWGAKQLLDTCDAYVLERPIGGNRNLSLQNITKTDYVVNQLFDSDSFELYLDENNGTIRKVTPIARYDFSTPGIKTVMLQYRENTICFPVKVVEKAIENITIDANTKTQYTYGDAFELPVLNITYNDGSSVAVVPDADDCIVDMTSAGNKTVTVSYDGETISYAINIAKKEIQGQVSVLGEAQFDKILTAKAEVTPPDATFSYQWYRNGTKIAGAVDAEYTITSADVDQTLHVRITATGNYSGTFASEIINAFCEHNYNWKVLAPENCENEGIEEGSCACGDIIQREIPPTGHTPGADATCTEDQTCTVCGEVLKEKLGHDEIPHETKDPTCTEIGWDAYGTCSRCDYTTYVEKSVLGHAEENHSEQPATCTEIGYTAGVYCTRCETWLIGHVEIPPHGHIWSEWTERIPATTTSEGEEVRTCGRCGEEENRLIDKLPLPDGIVIAEPYTIAKVFNGFAVTSVNTTVADILAASNGTNVLTATGEKANATEKLATGMQLVILNGETVVDSMEIAVLGDINGDGAIMADDARAALRASVGLDTLNDVQQTAANVDGVVAIAASDARAILRASVNLDDPTEWFKKF